MHFVNAVFPFENTFRRGSIRVEGGKIADIDQGADGFDCRGLYLLPGFIDTHIHGFDTWSVMDGVFAVAELAEALPRFGVTSFVPTTYSDSNEHITAALAGIKKANPRKGACILGAHLEGPYLNAASRGAQLEQHIRVAAHSEYSAWLDSGSVRIVTVAPEIPGNESFIKDCLERNIIVSMGHSMATFEEATHAVQNGVTRSTHTWNGMRQLHHREPGIVGAALTNDAVVCEIIADNEHVHHAVISLVYKTKGAEKMLAVTDAVTHTGAGTPRTESGALAGSVLTMDTALRNIIAATGASIEEVWPVTSRTAARELSLQKGEIAVGYDADFVLLDSDLEVAATIVAGEIVYTR